MNRNREDGPKVWTRETLCLLVSRALEQTWHAILATPFRPASLRWNRPSRARRIGACWRYFATCRIASDAARPGASGALTGPRACGRPCIRGC